jgi:hypothetical protein
MLLSGESDVFPYACCADPTPPSVHRISGSHRGGWHRPNDLKPNIQVSMKYESIERSFLSLLGRGPKKSSGRFCRGSSDTPNTMGTVVVASLAACAVARSPRTAGEPAGPQGRGVVPSAGPAVVDRYVLALDIAGFFEALAKSAQPLGNHFGRSDLKKSDDRHRWLLAARRERPRGCRTAEQRDELASSFDHLVGAGDERQRNGEAEGLCGLEVDDQLHFRRLLDRQVGGLRSLENSAGIYASLPIYIQCIS